MNAQYKNLVSSSAEGSQLVGALFKGNSAAPSTHYDHDEDGSLSSGKTNRLGLKVTHYVVSFPFLSELYSVKL